MAVEQLEFAEDPVGKAEKRSRKVRGDEEMSEEPERKEKKRKAGKQRKGKGKGEDGEEDVDRKEKKKRKLRDGQSVSDGDKQEDEKNRKRRKHDDEDDAPINGETVQEMVRGATDDDIPVTTEDRDKNTTKSNKKSKHKSSKDNGDELAKNKKKKHKKSRSREGDEAEPPKSKKHKHSKRKSSDPDPTEDNTLSEQASKALSYAYCQIYDPESWKFNKARQNWLIRNVWSNESVPDTYLPLAIKYLAKVQGGVRENLLKVCNEAVHPPPTANAAAGSNENPPLKSILKSSKTGEGVQADTIATEPSPASTLANGTKCARAMALLQELLSEGAGTVEAS